MTNLYCLFVETIALKLRPKGGCVNTFVKNFEAAYADFWNVVGILISGIAIFNFLTRSLQFEPSALISNLLAGFRAVFHPIVEFFFGWMPLALTETTKDALTLYFVAGGAVSRTFLALTRQIGTRDVHRDAFIGILSRSSFARVVGALLCVLLWPIALAVFWIRPIVVEFDPRLNPQTFTADRWFGRRMLRRRPAAQAGEAIRNKTYRHDLRAVFALQLLAALVVVAVQALQTAASAH
jgi:hypothetical protein